MTIDTLYLDDKDLQKCGGPFKDGEDVVKILSFKREVYHNMLISDAVIYKDAAGNCTVIKDKFKKFKHNKR